MSSRSARCSTTMLTGDRLQSETWREEAGPIRFYPPHVVSPSLEQLILRAVQFNPHDRWPNIDALKTELLKQSSEFKIRSAALTDVGMVRELNEDSVLAVEFFRDSQVRAVTKLSLRRMRRDGRRRGR